MLHVDRFISTITEKGRSKIIEEINPDSKTTDVDEALLVLVSVEKNDESSHENVVNNAVSEIAGQARKLKVNRILLHPFAHLFADLSNPKTARARIKLNLSRQLSLANQLV